MRYRLDANGYVESVFWGCYSNGCAEYTGIVPYGYTDLNDWSENALINAYYIDENGNLVLDTERLAELEAKIEQDSIDNEPLLRKDLYGTSDVLDTQYQNATAKGNVLVLTNVKKINPKVKITNIECYDYSKIDIITQGKNMLKNDAITETIAGVDFTRLINGGIRINGTATADIEYNLSGSSNNTTSLFALKKNTNYYLNIGGLDCELKYYDGTTSQVYTGGSGVINLSESKEVTQVLIKIPSGTTLSETIYPMLEYGSSATPYEEYKHRILTIDFNELIGEGLFPSDDLFPSDNLFPKGTHIDYISIEDSKVYVSADGLRHYLMKANVNLFDGYNIVYTMQDTYLEMTYCINELAVDDLGFLQGKSTTTNKFRVLEDGSIEAHNGYFSGKIEAESGTFKGTVDGGTINGGTINGTTINTNQDLTVGNNAYIGQNQGASVIDEKYLKFSDDVYLRRINVSGTESLNIHAPFFKINSNLDGQNTMRFSMGGSSTRIQAKNYENFIETSDSSSIMTFGNDYINITDSSITSSRQITAPSDERLKQNIGDVDVSWIDELKLKEFEYKSIPDKKQIGLIAQDYLDKDYSKYFLETIKIPNDEQEYYGISYGNITNALIKYCQELSNKVKILEDKIKEMESDNND